MADYLFYLLEANVLLVVLTGLYFIVRGQLSFKNRRMLLLLIPVFAVLLFVLKMTGPFSASLYSVPVYQLDAVTITPDAATAVEQSLFTIEGIYCTGFFLCLAFLLFRLIRVLLKLRRAKAERSGNVVIVRMKGERCFSFLNYVQLNPGLSPHDEEVVLEHEKIHISKKHSYDILLMELMHGINWFNPCFFILRRELINVHEYQVDEVMYTHYKTGYMEFLLAYSLGANSAPYLLTNQFYSTKTLVKRMDLMRKKTKNRWGIALALPVVACSFALVSWTFIEGVAYYEPTQGPDLANEKLEGELDKDPSFVGGQDALVNYLVENIRYPEEAKTNKIEGTVYVGFVITKTGSITSAEVRKPVNPLLDAEALRVVAGMPDWTPGEKEGKTVNAEMTLPISFRLNK